MTWEDEITQLLSEPVEAARLRSRQAFDRQVGERSGRIVLFGAGGIGRKFLASFRKDGVEPLAFCDNNPALWGHCVDGLPVLSPADSASRWASEAAFVVAVLSPGAGRSYCEVRGQLQDLGCQVVVSGALAAWKYPESLLPHYMLDLPQHVLENGQRVRQAMDTLADDRSREEYVRQVRWRLHLDFDALGQPAPGPQYFPGGMFAPRDDEVFVDCGAYDGDTLTQFLKWCHCNFRGYIAIECDRVNFERLKIMIRDLPQEVNARIVTRAIAVSDQKGLVSFDSRGQNSSCIVSDGGQQVECDTLDCLLESTPPTYIKMDIEGAEHAALRGAAQTLHRARPILAVSAYHSQHDLWEIPLLANRLCRDCSFFLRRHECDVWDVVLYAVPRERLLPGVIQCAAKDKPAGRAT